MFWVTGFMIVFLSFLVFYDVIARYFFSSPSRWGFDLSTWLTGMAAFLAGGYVLFLNEHVRVDIFYSEFSDRVKSIIDIFTAVFIFLIVIALVWTGGARVLSYYESGAISSTGLSVYLWVKWLMLPVGGLLLGLQALVNLINDIYTAITGKKLSKEGM